MPRFGYGIFAALIACTGLGLRADVVRLIDGTTLEGGVRRSDDGRWMVFVNGRPVFVATADVRSITLTPLSTPTTQAADDRLASLRRSVAHLSDLDQIIARYQLLLQREREPGVVEQAGRDLADYQALAAEHAIRVGDEWLTPAQRTARVAAGPPPIEAAREALKQDRLDDARIALNTATLLTPG